jgi:hypothetical protein
MKIEGADITISRSSLVIVESTDTVRSCLIKIKKSELGIDHPIVIKDGATFERNIIKSEIPKPIWLDAISSDDFLGVGDNYYHEEEIE